MSKALNKNVQFVKVNAGQSVPAGIPYRVKSFGLTESVVIVDKKATLLANDLLYQDMDCYNADKQVKLQQFKKS